MAGEIQTGAGGMSNVRFASWITSEVLLELRPFMVMRPFFRQAPAAKSLVYDFPKQDWLDPTNVTDPLAEATDLTTNTQPVISKASVTAAQMGIRATVTDLVTKVSIIDAMSHFQGVLSRTFAEKVETKMAALLAGFSNISDAAGVQTIANYLGAIAALEQRNVTSNLVAVLHPKPVGEIRSNLTTLTGTYWGRDSAADGPNLAEYHKAGYVTTLFNVPLHQTSVVPTSDTATKRAGGMFAAGEALGLYELWAVRTELQRDASFLATEVILSACFGVAEIDDTRGQTIKSAA
jgi:hypothetical protein